MGNRKLRRDTMRLVTSSESAPMSPPPSESSGPIIAFCSTLLMVSRTIKSNGVIWPSSRLPVSRKASSRNR